MFLADREIRRTIWVTNAKAGGRTTGWSFRQGRNYSASIFHSPLARRWKVIRRWQPAVVGAMAVW